MKPASIPSPLMKFLKLRIENRRKIFYNQCRHFVYISGFEPYLSSRGESPGVAPKVKPSRGGAVSTDSPKIH